eukprot:Gb_29743 [translate_table: standard]
MGITFFRSDHVRGKDHNTFSQKTLAEHRCLLFSSQSSSFLKHAFCASFITWINPALLEQSSQIPALTPNDIMKSSLRSK